jgi:rubrerythrin
MQSDKLTEIFDFAIEREKEAVLFYQHLQQMVRFSEKKRLLQKFEAMERGHIVILETIRREDIESMDVPEVKDLHISDYTVPVNPSAEMSYQDILILAMKKEEAAYRLYSDLTTQSSEPKVKKLFNKLASEEAKHKLSFEEMYDEEILHQH